MVRDIKAAMGEIETDGFHHGLAKRLLLFDGEGGVEGFGGMFGAAFGFFCYATYDLTNLATLKNWPVSIALADMAWGAMLSAAAAVVGFSIASRF